jgi:hypothetical protein
MRAVDRPAYRHAVACHGKLSNMDREIDRIVAVLASGSWPG